MRHKRPRCTECGSVLSLEEFELSFRKPICVICLKEHWNGNINEYDDAPEDDQEAEY